MAGPELPACLPALPPPFPVLEEACLGCVWPDLLLPLFPRLGPQGLLPQGWGCRQCLVPSYALSDLMFPPPPRKPVLSITGGKHGVEATFRKTYSLWNLGKRPGVGWVVTRGTNPCHCAGPVLQTLLFHLPSPGPGPGICPQGFK